MQEGRSYFCLFHNAIGLLVAGMNLDSSSDKLNKMQEGSQLILLLCTPHWNLFQNRHLLFEEIYLTDSSTYPESSAIYFSCTLWNQCKECECVMEFQLSHFKVLL